MLEKPAIQDRYSSPYYRTHYSPDEIEALRQQEEETRRKVEELEEEREQNILRWVTATGVSVTLRYGFEEEAMDFCFTVSINGGRERRYTRITPISDVPGIVAKIGNVGLTQERYKALLAMQNR